MAAQSCKRAKRRETSLFVGLPVTPHRCTPRQWCGNLAVQHKCRITVNSQLTSQLTKAFQINATSTDIAELLQTMQPKDLIKGDRRFVSPTRNACRQRQGRPGRTTTTLGQSSTPIGVSFQHIGCGLGSSGNIPSPQTKSLRNRRKQNR